MMANWLALNCSLLQIWSFTPTTHHKFRVLIDVSSWLCISRITCRPQVTIITCWTISMIKITLAKKIIRIAWCLTNLDLRKILKIIKGKTIAREDYSRRGVIRCCQSSRWTLIYRTMRWLTRSVAGGAKRKVSCVRQSFSNSSRQRVWANQDRMCMTTCYPSTIVYSTTTLSYPPMITIEVSKAMRWA